MFQEAEGGMFMHGGDLKLCPLFLYGQTLQPIEILAYGSFRTVMFYLYPQVIKALFKVQAPALVDDCIDITGLPIPGADRILPDLQNARYAEQQVDLLAEFLLGLIPEGEVAPGLDKAIRRIELTNENFDLASISDDFHGSQRTFQRLFKENVGISPRMYARVSRFNKALRKLESGDFQSLTDLALESDFSDQSHFIRTFREFTGMSPRAFLKMMEAYGENR